MGLSEIFPVDRSETPAEQLTNGCNLPEAANLTE